MSFILDALKKSEIERQRQAVPGLIESGPPAPRARFPLWAVALAVLLGVNLVVLAVVLTRHAAPASAPAAAPVAQQPAAAPAPPAAQHFSPLDAPPVYAPEIAPDSAPAASAPPLVRDPGVRAPLTPHVTHLPRMRDPILTPEEEKADQEVLPSISELNLTGRQALPELHIDVHVFATQPAERFVYINMRKYREGATLAEGPVLERIRRDGVVLNYEGMRFVLPRQQ
jgi:general secretion pathway protein B